MTRIASLVGVVVATFTVIGLISQVIAYSAATFFYRKLAIEPSDMGITPLNAAVRLNNTWLALSTDLLRIALVASGIYAVVYFSSQYAAQLLSILTDVRSKQVADAKRGLVDPTVPRLRRASVEEEYAKYVSNMRRLEVRSQKLDTWKNLLKPAFVALLALLSVAALVKLQSVVVDLSGAAQRAAISITEPVYRDPSPQYDGTLESAITTDLRAIPVEIQWNDPKRRPLELSTPVGLADLRAARLIATANGRFVVFLPGEQRIVYLSATDVTLAF